MKTYARKCDHCGKLFNEGYCIDNGFLYFCSDLCLKQNYTNGQIDILGIGDDDSDSYYTQWEKEDHLFNDDGIEIEVG